MGANRNYSELERETIMHYDLGKELLDKQNGPKRAAELKASIQKKLEKARAQLAKSIENEREELQAIVRAYASAEKVIDQLV